MEEQITTDHPLTEQESRVLHVTMTDEERAMLGQAEIPKALQRKLQRAFQKAVDTPRPMDTRHGGMLANDAYGNVYAREVRTVKGEGRKGAGNIRVVFNGEGQPIRAGHRNKQIREAELKAHRMARKAAARVVRESRTK